MKMLKSLLAIALLAGFTAVQVHAADAKKDLKPYPLKTCVVSGDKLGEMGDPYVYEYKGREIKFCCKNCVKDFNKNPSKYLKEIEKAEKAEAKAKK